MEINCECIKCGKNYLSITTNAPFSTEGLENLAGFIDRFEENCRDLCLRCSFKLRKMKGKDKRR